MRKKRGICFLCLFAAMVLVAGCTVQQNGPVTGKGMTASTTAGMTSSDSGVGKDTVIIRIKDSSFDPPVITVPAGTAIVWTNEDTLAHRVTSTGKGTVRLDSSSLSPGQTYTRVFRETGRFDYADNQHSFMTGTIIVV
ncbi:MAG TPA: cupredoxin domain-containing protein [Methanoregulaceae archaeon]|nr:cupredoxin domain-containing protein [Methanoregulaceae archaeon]